LVQQHRTRLTGKTPAWKSCWWMIRSGWSPCGTGRTVVRRLSALAQAFITLTGPLFPSRNQADHAIPPRSPSSGRLCGWRYQYSLPYRKRLFASEICSRNVQIINAW
jgi:hypothetical protein